ncbi:MAG TPA: NAD(P)/FAD-dependent oxidoreductase [bacterium]|nr:NAD(P)/FAD-dependent oxidoreductase [bacterium]HOL47246.1 NAD(P)/FAD-dependent oxidoreductase [bacterium]HPQ19282.1 NAD(P)/FAD-dependent oxidoreductase [bacterium]
MDKVKITIIGAGVVGLAIAYEISKKIDSIIILEKNERYGFETSSRNSEVIHSGIYYPTNSLKAKLCVEGKYLLYEFCKKNKIPHKQTGKFIIATNDNELIDLENLYKQGIKNGVNDIKIIDADFVKKEEPYVKCKGAIISPSTGILNVHNFMDSLAAYIKKNNADIVCSVNIIEIEKRDNDYKIVIKDSDGEIFEFESEIVINSAGLNSDKIAQLVGIDIKKNNYELYYCKGDYFSVSSNKSNLINRLIYTVPHKDLKSLGIHNVIKLTGNMSLGPDAYYINKEKFDYNVSPEKKYIFYESVKKWFPVIELDDLTPEMSGIRPKLQSEGGAFRDFVICEESNKGFPNFINLIGIESPGLTSALAIAKYVCSLINL